MAKITRIHLDVQKTCRTCLSQNVRNRNLFLIVNDIQLADILRTMTIIELAENDGLPQNVCESCAEKLLQIQEFKQSCKRVDKILQEFCDKRYVVGDEDEHNKIEEIITETTHDFIEGQDEETPIETYEDFKMEYVQGEDEVTNTVISDKVITENKIHISEEQVSELPNLKSESLQKTEIIVDHLPGYVEICCHICYKIFKTKYSLTRHLKIHKNGQYACVPCGNKFSTSRALALHNKCTHGQVSSYQCTQCDMHFARHFNLVMHNREHHVNCEMEIKEDNGGVIIQLKEDFNGDQQIEDPLKIDGGYSQEYVTSLNGGRTRKIHPCPTCGKIYISKIGLQRHERLHTGERPYLCTYCGKRFLMNTDLISHVRLHTGDCPYVCTVCGKAYTKKFYLIQHEKSHNKNKFRCSICSTEYDTISQLQRHQLLHENSSAEENENNAEEIEKDEDTAVGYRQVHKCLVCSKLYAHAHSLKEHMKSHEDRERLICDICGQNFRTAKTLKRHVTHHIERPQIKCHSCPKMFHSVFERNNHLVTHTESRPFLCTTCGMAFKTSPQLKMHNRVHTDERPYKCTICPKSFKQSATMHDHILTHSNDMIYPCKLCDKVYTKKGSLKSHVRRHQEDYKEKKHVCNICGKRFPLGAMLNSHMLTHENGNFKCSLCPKVFRSQRHLKIHTSTHTKDKMTNCPICGKGISRRSKLNIHMRTHTGERPYVCTVCGKGCTTSTMLKVHLRTHSNKKRTENVENT